MVQANKLMVGFLVAVSVSFTTRLTADTVTISQDLTVQSIPDGVIVKSIADHAAVRWQQVEDRIVVSVIHNRTVTEEWIIAPSADRVRLTFRIGSSSDSIEGSYDDIDQLLEKRLAGLPITRLSHINAFLRDLKSSPARQRKLAGISHALSAQLKGRGVFAMPTYGGWCSWVCKCCSRSHGLFIWCCTSCVTCDWIEM